jgi:hypothetical protein
MSKKKLLKRNNQQKHKFKNLKPKAKATMLSTVNYYFLVSKQVKERKHMQQRQAHTHPQN